MAERVTMEPAKSIRVMHGDAVVAETTGGYVVHEQGLPDRYYIPRADVTATIGDGTGAGICPWKGEWKHLNVTVGGTAVANGAWTYFKTKPATAAAQDFVAFYESKFQISAS